MFSVGDRVMCFVDGAGDNEHIRAGMLGTVCDINSGRPPIGVCWDDRIAGGHNCGGRCKQGNGWYVYGNEIELYKEDEDDDLISFDEDELYELLGLKS